MNQIKLYLVLTPWGCLGQEDHLSSDVGNSLDNYRETLSLKSKEKNSKSHMLICRVPVIWASVHKGFIMFNCQQLLLPYNDSVGILSEPIPHQMEPS